jgi:hypothetical protein
MDTAERGPEGACKSILKRVEGCAVRAIQGVVLAIELLHLPGEPAEVGPKREDEYPGQGFRKMGIRVQENELRVE